MIGTAVNGVIVPDDGVQLREGEKYYFELEKYELDPRTLPKDHPMAPLDPQYDLALIRESIASGEKGVPLRQVFEEIYRENGLGPLPPK